MERARHVPAQWQEGFKDVFLMASTRGRLLVLGGGPVHGSDALDSRMGACLWDLSLRQRTGGRGLDGETFSGRLWIFFLGGWGRGRGLARARTAEHFSQETRGFKRPHCLLYYMLSSGGFAAPCARQSRTKSPILDALGQTRALFGLRPPVDLVHALRR